jgi:hypothetical protein
LFNRSFVPISHYIYHLLTSDGLHIEVALAPANAKIVACRRYAMYQLLRGVSTNRDTDPPIQKLLHTVGMLCIDYYEACQRKNRANSWNDCHSRVEVSRQQSQKKICWDFVYALLELAAWLQAAGRGGPRYCGGQQSGLKKRLSSPSRGRGRDSPQFQSPVPSSQSPVIPSGERR